MRRVLAVLALTLAACGGDAPTQLARTPGTTTTSTSTVPPATTSAPATTVAAPRPATPTTGVRPTAPRMTTPVVVLIKYRVELHTNDEATAGFPATVDAILTDRRGWQQAGFVFERAEDGPYTILLGEGPEVQQRCRPYDTYGKYSCQLGPMVAITADRWRVGTPEWTGDLASYRQMIVNHEVGHLIGLHHRKCPVKGRPAPVMLPQSTELNGCLPNPWPLPDEIERVGRHDLRVAPGYEPGDPVDSP